MRYLISLCILISFQSIYAQCPDGQLVLRTQQDIHTFAQQFPNCTRIDSGLFISGNDIQDLRPLEQLTYVAQALEVVDNPNLRSLQGLHNIIEFEVFMPSPPAPPQSGSIVINNNVLLDDLDALAKLKPLSSNDFIALTITIQNNQSLTSINGLSGLDKGITFITIAGNARLSTLNGLQNIKSSIGIDLDSNAALNDITALERLELGRAGIRVVDNQMLSQCAVSSVCNAITTNTDNVTVLNNNKGCDTKEQVEASCQSVLAAQDINLNKEVFLYPNPTTGIVNVSLSSDIEIKAVTVYSILGSKVFATSSNQLDFSTLETGVYFVSISTGQGNIIKRVTKQ